MARAVALALAAALALPAYADDAVVAPPLATDATEAVVIETAKLDAAAIEEGAALELFGLSNAGSTALVFLLVAVTLTVITSSDSQGIPP